jgi:hypothetical protein
MKAVKISVPYVAFPIRHSELNDGSLLTFNAYINSMTGYCICKRTQGCVAPQGQVQVSPPTVNDNQWLLIFIKQTEIDPLVNDKLNLNLIVNSPQLIIGHCVIEITRRAVWDSEFNMKEVVDFMEIISFCKHQSADNLPSRMGYERVMLNAILRFSDRLCNNHYQWIAIDYQRTDFNTLVKDLVDYGFGTPYPVVQSISGIAYGGDYRVALFKKSTYMGLNEAENRINFVKAIHIRNRLFGQNEEFRFIFDEKTLNNLRLMPFFVTGRGDNGQGSDLCTPTTPITTSEIKTIVEYGGKFIITDAIINPQGEPTYVLSMDRPSEGFYSYDVGKPEEIDNIPEGSINFHTHPYTAYPTRFPGGGWSIPSQRNPNPVPIPQGSKMVISYPSSKDYSAVYNLSVFNKRNPIQIHCVIAVEGIWTISVNKEAFLNPNTSISMDKLYNVSVGMNDILSSVVAPSENYTGYAGQDVDDSKVTTAVNDYLALINDYNSRYGNIFTVQFHTWKYLSNNGPIIHGSSTVGAARMYYGGDRPGFPLVILEDYKEAARLYDTINPSNLYAW